MEEKNITEKDSKIEILPLWNRIIIFVIMLPVLLVMMPIIMLFLAFAFEVGIVVIMVEFLITGESKVDTAVTFGTEKENKNENNA